MSDTGPRDSDTLHVGSDWTWAVDAALRLTELSPGLAAWLGRSIDGLLGEPLGTLGDLGEGPLAGLALGERVDGQLLVVTGADGRPLRFRLSAQPLRDDHGTFAGYRGFALSDPALDDEAQRRFHSALEHEFRTPLNAIIGFAEAMSLQLYGPLAEHYADYARDIAGAGRHLLALIGDVLDSPGPDAAPRLIDAWPIVEEALTIVEFGARAKRVDLSVTGGDRAMVRADERRLRQILLNLLGNAVKFTPDGGRIDVDVAAGQEDMVEIAVRDTGPGIAPEDQERIFGKFAQAAQPDQARQGAGLGLHIARTLARAMGGDLRVESEPGRGARFVLTLVAA